MTKQCLKAFALSVIFLPAALSAQSNELVIRDTAGVVRNVTMAEGNAIVEFHVSDASGQPADGAEITLRNDSTGKSFNAVTANGVVRFEGIEPGPWVVASLSPNVTFTDILVLTAEEAALAGTGMAFGPPLLIGGAAAAGIGTTAFFISDSDSKDKEMSPSS